jgi:protease-4
MRRFRWALVALLALAGLAWLARRIERPDVEAGSALRLELAGDYVEAADPPLLVQILGRRQRSFVGTLSELRKAERDARLAHVVLVVRDLEIGWAKAQELREAILALRAAGRRPVAYLETGGFGANLEYYVASAAERVYLAPGSGAPLVGLAQEFLFLGGLWERFGIDVQVAQAGRYKGAAESLTAREMSEPYREQAEALLDSIDAQFVAGIAEARGVPEPSVRRALELASARPETLEALGLVDGVETRAGLIERLGDPPVVEAGDYAAVDPAEVGFQPEATFALVYGAGPITTGEGALSRTGQPVLAADTVVKAIEEAAEDDSVRAIVLRIDSPGGGSLPSELVWRAIRRAREHKPVVASFSDYAASGGYYLASACDAIVAAPATLTGSIGVFAVRPALGGLLARLDVASATLLRAPHAEINLALPELSDDTREWLQADVRRVYDLFLARVGEGRRLEPERAEAVAQGRVWTGAQAAERGLVDALGGLRASVARAKEEVGIAADVDVALRVYPAPKPLAEQLRDAVQGRAVRSLGEGLPLAGAAPALARAAVWLETLAAPGPLLALPFWIEIH